MFGRDKRPRVAIIGLGGLGSAVVNLIDAPTVILFDDDIVQLDNLGRQLYYETDIGKRKVDCIRERLGTKIIAHPIRLSADKLHLLDAELVLDCTDDIETKYMLNDHCIGKGIPLISCSVVGDRGHVKYVSKGSCLRCMKIAPVPETSVQSGILNSAVFMGASIQARLAKDFLSGSCTDRLIFFDIWLEELRTITVNRRADCPVCRI